MKSGKILLYAFLVLSFCVSGCREDKKKESFSGVSELIVSRNQARFNINRKKNREKDSARDQSSDKTSTKAVSGGKNLATVILYPKKLKSWAHNLIRYLRGEQHISINRAGLSKLKYSRNNL